MSFITRSLVMHLDFTESANGGKYTFANIEEDEKRIYLDGFGITRINENTDWIWPSSVTVVRNNNYTFSIQGVNEKIERFVPPVVIDCNENWTITFDNYDSNTKIHLFGTVQEPKGRNVNY